MSRKKCGLKPQSLIALLISLAAAVLVFFITDQVSTALLEKYFEESTYNSKKSAEVLDRFEEYITENRVAANDSTAINDWMQTNKSVTLILYINRGGETLYDSLQSTWQSDETAGEESAYEPGQYNGSDYSDNSWFYKRDVTFSDGSATVSLYGYFDQWVYDISFVAEIILFAVVLCLVFIWLIQRKINYILQLEEEIKVIETGGLNFPITVKGCDELTSLADNLNQMRLALSDNQKTEAAAVKSNYDLVVAVSHDLRTPLTSLALYLDLIHAGKYKTQEELNAYLEKSRSKVAQIKQMTDSLFERFYLEKGDEKALEAPESVKAIFEDSLSNTVSYLGENGFTVQTKIVWPEQKACVSSDYINRILDNISSNVLKYADPAYPVNLETGETGQFFQICISNRVKPLERKPDSTEVGLDNIRFMMDKMNGECMISQNNSMYMIWLNFKLEPKER